MRMVIAFEYPRNETRPQACQDLDDTFRSNSKVSVRVGQQEFWFKVFSSETTYTAHAPLSERFVLVSVDE